MNDTQMVDISATICEGQTYNFNNQNLSTAGIYSSTVTTVQGCDSNTILTLNVTQINSIVSLNNGILSVAPTAEATYQWVDCNNNNTPILGAIDASYTPNTTNNYAVIVSLNNCYEISNCTQYIINIEELEKPVRLYPNPTQHHLIVDIQATYILQPYQIINIVGQVVQEGLLTQTSTTLDLENLAPGIYTFSVGSSKYLFNIIH